MLYTIGHGHLPINVFIARLKQRNINCVVDIRNIQNHDSLGVYNHDSLRDILKKYGILLISFFEEFGFIPQTVRNVHGNIVYRKLVKLESFQNGIRRLSDGLSKGYIIAILEYDPSINVGLKHNVIAKYLNYLGTDVTHIDTNGSNLSFEQAENVISEHHYHILETNKESSEIGINGEEIAAMFLQKNGHMILHHNWNLHHGCELDLVTRKDGVLHFVEVKTRSSEERGNPHQAISYKKLLNIHRAIKYYLQTFQYDYLPYQVDSISVVYHDEDDYTVDIKENIHY